MYKKLINPTEEQVSNLLEQEYILHSITPIMVGSQYSYNLIYHFIKEVQKINSYYPHYIGVDLAKPWHGTDITCNDSNNTSVQI